MNTEPITHLIIDTSSSNEDYNGDCDFCLVQMSLQYVADLLGYIDQVAQMRKADDSVYNIECWDATPSYFRYNDKVETIRDIDGNLINEVPEGGPLLLTAAPDFDDDDFQRVECGTVQVSHNEVWWTCYVKHTNVRIETAHVSRKTLLKIRQRFTDHKGMSRVLQS